jgi:cobyrinic acid a,c-diamide synthase
LHIPRLVLADERRSGMVPVSVLFAAALRERGYPLRLFATGLDEVTLCLLRWACRQEVTLLEPFLAGGEKPLQLLFESAADPSALNLIVGPLATEREREDKLLLDRWTLRVAQCLDAPLLPVLNADSAAALAARTAENLFRQLQEFDRIPQMAICFNAVLNPKEYQLLEIELGRRLPWIAAGYFPASLGRELPLKEVLFTQEVTSPRFFSLRSAVAQLCAMEDEIFWSLVAAMSKLAPEWTPLSFEVEPFPAALNVVVLRHPALGLGGDNLERLLHRLGAWIVEVRPDETIPSEADVLYVPHGAEQYIRGAVLNNANLKRAVGQFVFGNKAFLMEGNCAALAGERIFERDGSEWTGLGIFPVQARYSGNGGNRSGKEEKPLCRVEAQCVRNGPLLRSGERVRGYWSPNLVISGEREHSGEWSVLDVKDRKELLTDSWSLKRGIITQLRIEPWNCIHEIRRWLAAM